MCKDQYWSDKEERPGEKAQDSERKEQQGVWKPQGNGFRKSCQASDMKEMEGD